VQDPLTTARIAFFFIGRSSGTLLEEISDHSANGYLYDDLGGALRSIMTRFIKKSYLENAKQVCDLVKIDVTSKKCTYKDVVIGFMARKAIADCRGLLDGQKRAFRTECLEFLTKMTSKLIERCPLNYKVVRSISCLVPSTILNNHTISEKRMDTLLPIFS